MLYRNVTITIPLTTRENPDKLIPEGTYEVRMTWSPKFGKPMPEVMHVPGRTGIRLHLGTHSEGCLLLDEPQYSTLRQILTTYEKATLTISRLPPTKHISPVDGALNPQQLQPEVNPDDDSEGGAA